MARRFNQFRQERYNIDYWIEYVTTDNDICCKVLASILRGRRSNGDICEAQFNSVLHRDFSLYPLAVLLSGASNLLLRQSKNCPVSFSAVPCSRRAPTLAIVPLTTTEACQSIRVCPSSTAVSLMSPDKSTALPGALPLPFIVICSGSSISGRVTSSVNFVFTAPTPTPTTAFQCSSSNTSRL